MGSRLLSSSPSSGTITIECISGKQRLICRTIEYFSNDRETATTVEAASQEAQPQQGFTPRILQSILNQSAMVQLKSSFPCLDQLQQQLFAHEHQRMNEWELFEQRWAAYVSTSRLEVRETMKMVPPQLVLREPAGDAALAMTGAPVPSHCSH